MVAIRGAITVRENTAADIDEASVELIRTLAEKNDIAEAVCIIISTTADITAKYPATAIRESGVLAAPLFSCAEPGIDGALKMCIRVMVLTDKDITAKHVYLRGARSLRKDLEDDNV